MLILSKCIFIFCCILFAIIVVIFNFNNFLRPLGKFSIGYFDIQLVDNNRLEKNSNIDKNRELMVRFWYPADNVNLKAENNYDYDAMASEIEFFSNYCSYKIPKLFFWGLMSIKTYSIPNKKISKKRDPYPVIILSNAWGTMAQHYTWLAEELASQGFIVVGINHPYIASIVRFPDGRIIKSLTGIKRKEGKIVYNQWKKEQMETMVQDDKFLLNKLTELNSDFSCPLYKKMDLNSIGIIGHSFAGSLALLMCLNDERVKVGIALDSAVRNNNMLVPFNKPFLHLLSEKSHVWKGSDGKEDYEILMKYSKIPGMKMKINIFKDIGHSVFSDLPLLLDQTLLTKLLSYFINFDLDTSIYSARKNIINAKNLIIPFFTDNLVKKIN